MAMMEAWEREANGEGIAREGQEWRWPGKGRPTVKALLIVEDGYRGLVEWGVVDEFVEEVEQI